MLLIGCTPKPKPLATPEAFAPSTRVAFLADAAGTLPTDRQLLRIGWRSDDGHLQLSGAGAVRIAPPDSLRLDIAATLGLGRSVLLLMGDSVAAQPAQSVDQVLPDRFALWAALGIMQPPVGTVRFESAESGTHRWWRTSDAAGRVTTFELADGALQRVTREENGRPTQQLTLGRDRAGLVNRANLLDTGRGFRLQVTVNTRQPGEVFTPEIWRLRS